jgi:phosphoglucomutase
MNFEEKYKNWLASTALSEAEKSELLALSGKEIEDRFYCDLAFGTGGLRGVMAVGSNRMNLHVVRAATEGLARELLDADAANAARGVVIGYDSRNHSAKFARAAAEVLSAFGIRANLFDRLCPTPEVSFAVRHLGCAAGIVITASHNPKEYNGYKVYDEEGTQISPLRAERILSYIRKAELPARAPYAPNPALIHLLSEETHSAYVNRVRAESMGVPIPEDLSVLYTPLHGAGNLPVQSILSSLGVRFTVVKEQEAPNGDFPTVDSPNPENRSAFDLAISYAENHPVDLILGTDPDSDRLGLVVKEKNGTFTVLNGNQTGSLLAEFILRKTKERGMPKNPRIVKTIVTTELVREIAKHYGAETEDVLTGFKYIGDKIKAYESEGKTFLFGLEESYGYLKGTYARDKDAVVAAMLAAELAAECKAEGITLTERLEEIHKRYGYHKEQLLSFTFKGIEGQRKIESLMQKLRAMPPIEGETERIDYKKGIGNLPKSDVLKLFLSDGWIAARPSGTEPKIKFYLAAKGETASACNAAIEKHIAWVNALVAEN